MHLWGLLQERSFSPGAHVTGDLPCQGCGYNLREAEVSGVCPECGRRVGDSLVPLDKPEKAAAGLRHIGNSYLGLIALPLVPFAAGVAASCAGWVGVLALLFTSIVRAGGVADLRFRSGAGQLPVIGQRLGMLWMAAVADVVLVAGCLLLLLAGAAGGEASGAVKGLAMATLGLWLVVAAVVAAVAGWMGTALAAMLGYAPLAKRLRLQWMLVASGPAVGAGFVVLGLLAGAAGGAGASAAVMLLGLLVIGVLLLVGIGLTLSCLSELAKVVERARDPRENVIRETRTPSPPGQAPGPGPRPC
jgi:hypothetical protein